MSQGVLSYNYKEAKNKSGATALGGLPVYLDLAHILGLNRSVTDTSFQTCVSKKNIVA